MASGAWRDDGNETRSRESQEKAPQPACCSFGSQLPHELGVRNGNGFSVAVSGKAGGDDFLVAAGAGAVRSSATESQRRSAISILRFLGRRRSESIVSAIAVAVRMGGMVGLAGSMAKPSRRRLAANQTVEEQTEGKRRCLVPRRGVHGPLFSPPAIRLALGVPVTQDVNGALRFIDTVGQ